MNTVRMYVEVLFVLALSFTAILVPFGAFMGAVLLLTGKVVLS